MEYSYHKRYLGLKLKKRPECYEVFKKNILFDDYWLSLVLLHAVKVTLNPNINSQQLSLNSQAFSFPVFVP